MQFKPELVDMILAGRKTQTRRPVKEGDYALIAARFKTRVNNTGDLEFVEPEKIVGVKRMRRRLWNLNHTYAICPGRGKPQVARFRLLAIRQEDVRNISVMDSVAEGFVNEIDFWKTWCGFYDPPALAMKHFGVQKLQTRPDELYDAWALTFELADKQSATRM